MVNLVLGCFLVLPYLIPYVLKLWEIPRNVDYASKVFGMGDAFKNRKDLFYFLLYNPFVTWPLFLGGVIVGTFFFKKTSLFVIWFWGLLFVFRFLVKYSGLHF